MGTYMEQQRLNDDQMLTLIMEHLRQQQPQQLNQQLHITMLQPPAELAPLPSGGAPPPPPGAGAAVKKSIEAGATEDRRAEGAPATRGPTQALPVPETLPVPPAPQVPTFDISSRGRSRSQPREPRPKAAPRTSALDHRHGA